MLQVRHSREHNSSRNLVRKALNYVLVSHALTHQHFYA
jgi:hypothetical protein